MANRTVPCIFAAAATPMSVVIQGRPRRYSTYTWLSKQLGIPRELTHVGMSDIEQCGRIAEICRNRLIEEVIRYELWPED